MNRPITLYYAATIGFITLDYVFGINVRVAFFEQWPTARLLYYAICCGCFVLMLWRPAWSGAIAAVESLTVIVSLIFSTAIRVMVPNIDSAETGAGLVTQAEIINFVIVGTIAYSAWSRAIKSLNVSKMG